MTITYWDFRKDALKRGQLIKDIKNGWRKIMRQGLNTK